MIRSDVGVTACISLVAGTVYGRDPSRRVFTTFLECVLADGGVFTLRVITCPLRASPKALVNLISLDTALQPEGPSRGGFCVRAAGSKAVPKNDSAIT